MLVLSSIGFFYWRHNRRLLREDEAKAEAVDRVVWIARQYFQGLEHLPVPEYTRAIDLYRIHIPNQPCDMNNCPACATIAVVLQDYSGTRYQLCDMHAEQLARGEELKGRYVRGGDALKPVEN